jgi:hypothetical protein
MDMIRQMEILNRNGHGKVYETRPPLLFQEGAGGRSITLKGGIACPGVRWKGISLLFLFVHSWQTLKKVQAFITYNLVDKHDGGDFRLPDHVQNFLWKDPNSKACSIRRQYCPGYR